MTRLVAADAAEDAAYAHEARGETEAALEQWLRRSRPRVARAQLVRPPPSSSRLRVEVVLRRLHYVCRTAGRSALAVDVFSSVVEDAGLPPFVRDVARTYRSLHASVLGWNDAARADDAALGVVSASS